ncbi:hypothetical protein LSAT2_003689 [Lamellibrachia satsuma]|nr:hypothetical protein LSAT2_003689 [Lamellibrachia satsuma]
MKSEEEQHITTGNQLQSLDAAPEDARCTPADISQSPIWSQTCGCVASVSLVNQSSDDFQVLKGLTSIKSEKHLAEMHSQEGFLPFDKTCHEKDRRQTDHCEPHIQVKAEKVEPDEPAAILNGGLCEYLKGDVFVAGGENLPHCLMSPQCEDLPHCLMSPQCEDLPHCLMSPQCEDRLAAHPGQPAFPPDECSGRKEDSLRAVGGKKECHTDRNKRRFSKNIKRDSS